MMRVFRFLLVLGVVLAVAIVAARMIFALPDDVAGPGGWLLRRWI